MRRRGSIILIVATALVSACGEASFPPQPDLPGSVSPGWVRQSYEHSAPPAFLPTRIAPDCWKAVYTNKGSAQVWACGYKEGSSTFDAYQRAGSAADTVKFQEGRYLAVVTWSGVSRAEITALVRAVQKSLQVQ